MYSIKHFQLNKTIIVEV